MKIPTRNIYFVSDGTGISVETLGHSLLTQFDEPGFIIKTMRYINTLEKAEKAVTQINQENLYNTEENTRPIILSTIADKLIREKLFKANAFGIDFFKYLLAPLENELKTKATGTIGLSHAILSSTNYNKRIDAIDFALAHDDGISFRGYPIADLILIGISRSGKTPTCLYLAMQYGIQAANYPLTEDDFSVDYKLPTNLKNFKDRLFGLTISCERLHDIRDKRAPNSNYASLKQCVYETSQVEELFRKEKIPYINSTNLSVEELATQIISKAGLQSNL